ncbi:hypothetical protein HETIRDRAFT_430983 [Heterobasidion irregulare TC 32-1]|uniref:Uncharacterized protein n=1 Tax=Heterobasidion irregulare (strain TC 32-1) TaxID=747525 RepID=W4JMC9_HETIT|nr:uncharacterized protein HETIRDRAFT_430983 [Heterobasidion irregulare TC 32-1]ETW74707.1 hypothetical protein HETIRDRAFT_430983 [Heterobasidion irregulare TC 32-1]
MLLHEDHDVSSPSRNSSPDVVLMVSNPDVGRVDRGTKPAIVILTPNLNNFSDDDTEDYAKFKERERVHRPSPKGSPRNASWNENPDDRNPPGSDEIPVPQDYEQEQQLNSQAMEKLNRYQLYRELHLYSHSGDLERHADTLLQQNTISVVIQMATAMALQQLANFLAGQPGNENSDIPRQLASASLQIRGLALQTNPDTASWYEHNNGRPRALLIHPDEFSQYVNRELLPALLFTRELGAVQPSRTDPFRVVTWNHIAIPRLPPLTGYEIFPYPMGVPTRRNHLSIEEMKEGGVEEARQPFAAEQLLAGVFDTGLERLLLVLNFIQTRDRITEVAAELAVLIQRLEEIALGLDPSLMHGML